MLLIHSHLNLADPNTILSSGQPSQQPGLVSCASVNSPFNPLALIPPFIYPSVTWRWTIITGPLACFSLSRLPRQTPSTRVSGCFFLELVARSAQLPASQPNLHRHGNSSGSLFLFADGKPLSCLRVTARLRYILAEAGIQGNFSSHSFWIGAATSVHAAGIPDSLIRTLGQWSSNTYLVYVCTSHDTLRQAARQLASL